MGMEVAEFYLLTPRQFSNKMKGFTERENENRQDAWERMRFSTTALINVQLEKGKKISPEQLVKFEWDKKVVKAAMSVAEFEAMAGIK